MQTQAPRRSDGRRDHARGQSSPIGEAEAADIARYIADMTAQMEAMAAGAKLDFLAYLLGMARAECEAIDQGVQA